MPGWHCSAGYSRRNSDGPRPRSQAARPRGQSGHIRRVRAQAMNLWMLDGFKMGSSFLGIIMIRGWKGLDPKVNGRIYQKWLDIFGPSGYCNLRNTPTEISRFFVVAGPLEEWLQFTLDHNLFSLLYLGVRLRLQNVTNGYNAITIAIKPNKLGYTPHNYAYSWNCTFKTKSPLKKSCWGQSQLSECRWWPSSAHRGFVRISISEH